MKTLFQTSAVVLTLVVMAYGNLAQAQNEPQRYVRDWLSVALREEPSADSTTVHPGLTSGAPLTLLQNDAATGFSRVRTADGVEGWMPSRFLSEEPAARDRLAQLEAEITRLTTVNEELAGRLAALPPDELARAARLQELEQRNSEQAAELEAISQSPDSVGVLRTINAELEANNNALLSRIDSLTRELASLKQGGRQQQFINGALAVLVGIIAAMLIAWLWPRKKRSEWV